MVKRKRRLKSKAKRICFFLALCTLFGIFLFRRGTGKYASMDKKDPPTYVYKESVFPSLVVDVPVYTDLIEEHTSARPSTKRIIKYIVIHETDNFEKGVGALNHAEYLKRNNTSATSWHYTVDDKEIYHHIPDDEIAHHAGDEEGNEYGIGIELCVNIDGDFEKTFDNAAKLVAYLLKAYDLSIDNVKTHHDFSGKDCPHSILKENRLKEFRQKVKKYL